MQYNIPYHILLGYDFGASGIPPKVVQSPAEYATGHRDTFFVTLTVLSQVLIK